MKAKRILLLALVALTAAWGCQEKDPVDNVDKTGTEEGGGGNGGGGNGGGEGGGTAVVGTQALQFDDVDPAVYKYPKEGDKVNPNLIIPDYDKMSLEEIDLEAHTATLRFTGDVPSFYKGCVIVPVKDDEAYPMFVLSAETQGNTVHLEWRAAAIGEMVFNTSLGAAAVNNAATKAEDKKKLDMVLAVLNHIDAGLFFNFKGITLNLKPDVDVDTGKPEIQEGKSINAPEKSMKAIFTGTARTGATWGLEPSAKKSLEYKKPLKQSIFHKCIIIWTSFGIPIPVDFDVDLMAWIAFEIKAGCIKYSQDLDYTATITMGGTMDFETGKFTPVHSFTSSLEKSKPTVEYEAEVDASLTASIYPRIKTYVCKVKYVGLQADVKPIVGQVDFHGSYKEGHLLHSFETSLRTDVAFNAYLTDPRNNETHYLFEEEPTISKEWVRWKHPEKLTNLDENKDMRGSFNRENEIKVQVQDLDWDGARTVPAPDTPVCVEVEPFGSIPDPISNPGYYSNWEMSSPDGISGAPAARLSALRLSLHKGGAIPGGSDGWYSYGKTYVELGKDGTLPVPTKVEVPAGFAYKYVIRMLDGKGDVLEEVEKEIPLAVKEYTIKHRISGDGESLEPVCVISNYGKDAVEDTEMPEGCHGHVEYHGSSISGYLDVPIAGKVPVQAFFGNGTWLIRNHPVGPDGGLFTTSEGQDFVWWAYSKGLTNTLYGCHFSLVDFHGLPCTHVTGGDIGSLYYFQNIFLDLNNAVVVKTISLTGVDGWSYQ